jgi:hypothetical protein
MNKRVSLLVVMLALCAAGVAGGQGMILDMVANKVIQKYQSSSCEQLWEKKGQPKSQEEERAVNFLRNDPQARTEFFNKVAGPIVNKMFECGMIP